MRYKGQKLQNLGMMFVLYLLEKTPMEDNGSMNGMMENNLVILI